MTSILISCPPLLIDRETVSVAVEVPIFFAVAYGPPVASPTLMKLTKSFESLFYFLDPIVPLSPGFPLLKI